MEGIVHNKDGTTVARPMPSIDVWYKVKGENICIFADGSLIEDKCSYGYEVWYKGKMLACGAGKLSGARL